MLISFFNFTVLLIIEGNESQTFKQLPLKMKNVIWLKKKKHFMHKLLTTFLCIPTQRNLLPKGPKAKRERGEGECFHDVMVVAVKQSAVIFGLISHTEISGAEDAAEDWFQGNFYSCHRDVVIEEITFC